MLEAVDQTGKVRKCQQREAVQIGHERRKGSTTDAIRNPDAMVVKKVYTSVAVRTVIHLRVWSYCMAASAFKLAFNNFSFSFGLNYPWIGRDYFVVEPFSHD